MSKKKVELMPNDSNTKPTKVDYGVITEIRDDCVIVIINVAQKLIPMHRFIKESDKANLYVDAKVKINYYFNQSGKKLLAYNAELTTE